MACVIKYDKFDFDNFQLKKPKKQKNSYYAEASYNQSPVFIQTPKIRNVHNLSGFTFDSSHITIDVGETQFYHLLKSLDETVLSKTHSSWKDWTGNTIPLEGFQKMYQPIVKDSSQIQVKLPMHRKKLLTKVFDSTKQDRDIQELDEDMELITILHLKGIKYTEKSFSCDLYVTQIKLFPYTNQLNLPQECLIDSESEIDEDVVDHEDLERMIRRDKLNVLLHQKQEELVLLDQIQLRIQNIESEIEKLN